MRHVLYEHTLLGQAGRFHVSLIVSFISSLTTVACSQYRYLNTIGPFRTRLKIPLSNNLPPGYTWNNSRLRSESPATVEPHYNYLLWE